MSTVARSRPSGVRHSTVARSKGVAGISVLCKGYELIADEFPPQPHYLVVTERIQSGLRGIGGIFLFQLRPNNLRPVFCLVLRQTSFAKLRSEMLSVPLFSLHSACPRQRPQQPLQLGARAVHLG